MNEKQIGLVQHSFTKVAPSAISASSIFYQKLFETSPHLQDLFESDLKKQGDMLIKVLGMAVNSLYDLPSIATDLRALGARHVNYGVKEEYYDDLEKALFHMLKEMLEDEFDEELKEAWHEVYKMITGIMKSDCYSNI